MHIPAFQDLSLQLVGIYSICNIEYQCFGDFEF